MRELQRAIEEITYSSASFLERAFQVIAEHREEALPYLRAAVEKAIWENDNLDENYHLHFYALFLLGQFQDTQSFPKILELISLPCETVDYLIGDAATQGLSDILYNTCNGNPEQLKHMITDRKINEYVRSSIIPVLGQLYLDGRLSGQELKNFLKSKIQTAKEYDHIYDEIAYVVCKCHFADMLPQIRFLLDNGLMAKSYLGPYDSCVDAMFQYDGDDGILCKSPIDTAQIQRWIMFCRPENHSQILEKYFAESRKAAKAKWNPPVSHEKISGGDPCPCGSGKKYMFCCMNKLRQPMDQIESPVERQRWLRNYPAVGGERIPGRIYLEDYYDRAGIEIDQILYLGLMNRSELIESINFEEEDSRTRQYLYLAFQKTRELADRENIVSLDDFDNRHSIHYLCEEWLDELLFLLKESGDRHAYAEVRAWVRKMSK